jgi:hypothetical protein
MKIKDIIDEAGYYRGYPCTKDCSGHIAGYNWAIKKGIQQPQDCPYRTSHNSFWEGCKSKTQGR